MSRLFAIFDREELLRELDPCREIVLQIPLKQPEMPLIFGIQLAVAAILNRTENLRYLVYFKCDGQCAIRYFCLHRGSLPQNTAERQPRFWAKPLLKISVKNYVV